MRPNKQERLPVDLLNIADIIEQICKEVYVKKALSISSILLKPYVID